MAYSNISISGKGKESKDHPNVGLEKEIYKALRKLNKNIWIRVQKAFGKDNYYIDIFDGGNIYKYNNDLSLSTISTQSNYSNYIRKVKKFDIEIENMKSGIYKVKVI